MSHHIPKTPSNQGSEDFDLSSIFIGRQPQLDLFDIFLNRWQNFLLNADDDDTPITTAPSPSHKIQGLVVLLYGRGGFGKSTLLQHYKDIAQQEHRHLFVSATVDWEFAVEGKRSIFNPAPGQEVDASEYYKVLCWHLATALERSPKDFKAYQVAVKEVERAHKDIHNTLDSMQKDGRYDWLRGLAVEGITAVVRAYVPGSKVVLDNQKVIDATNAAAKLTQDQVGLIYSKLHNKLGNRWGDYLEPSLRLGLALGKDLCDFARNFPLLLFFDTYEEIDEGDRLLRTVMGAAGKRVGWVIAGRDNLWAGAEQRERSLDVEYGYKDLVRSERGLSINFNAGDVGAFTLGDIQEYFALLRKKVPNKPPLPQVTEEQASRILDVTQGVPLAVKIAAGLYVETADVDTITETVEGKREIVDQMVRRYLLHTKASQLERAPLFGLALLRRADIPATVAVALGLTAEQAKTSYSSTLSRLHRRYSFIFTEKEQPSLHQEVRYFLRLWLLEHRKEPEILAIIQQLQKALMGTLKDLEQHMSYSTLKERLQDDEWVGAYLDLTEYHFWVDPVEGVRYALPFMIAAAVYRREVNEDAATSGEFFEKNIRQPYRNWWTWVTQSLIYMTSRKPSPEESGALEELVKLAKQRCPSFPPPLPDYQKELEAALWWRLAESYQGSNETKALEWYEQALSRIENETELNEAASQTYCEIGEKQSDEEKYKESIPFLNQAIALQPDYPWAYAERGYAYENLNEHQRAIEDLDHAIALDPSAYAYSARGYSYINLEKYQRAIEDLDHAIALDPNYAYAYSVRGRAYSNLKEYKRAIQDYDQAISLDPSDAYAYVARGDSYINLEKYQRAIQDYDQAISFDPKDADTYNNRGTAYNNLKEYKRAIQDYDQVISLDPNYADAYHNRGFAFLWLQDASAAKSDYDRAYKLDPTDMNAAWMSEWTNMNKQGVGRELAIQLEKIASIDAQHYASHVCRGVASGLNNKLKEGLEEMEKAISLEPEGWDAFFWKGMLSLYYYQRPSSYEEAIAVIQHALALDLPPILLTPLYWLKRDKPTLFETYIEPLLLQHNV